MPRGWVASWRQASGGLWRVMRGIGHHPQVVERRENHLGWPLQGTNSPVCYTRALLWRTTLRGCAW